tara:strand:+ start:820 stop:1185 length:366 start_codon:yes stop_codon:yes gene_type:complete
MSSLASWSYVEGPVTIWPPGGYDDFNQPIDAPPYLIPNIDYEFGGEAKRESDGTEFVPRITIYFEAAFDSALVPEREWYLKLGDHLATTSAPADAERIRMVESFPAEKFGAGELPDWIVTT